MSISLLRCSLSLATKAGGTTSLRRGVASMSSSDKLGMFKDIAMYARTRKPVDEAHTLPGMVYEDETFFKLEQDQVFRSQWVVLGEAAAAAEHGEVYPVNAAGQPLVVVNGGGERRVFHNVCRHRGAQLVDCASKKKMLVCPYHNWGYSLTGKLIGTPMFDDKMPRKRRKEMEKAFDTRHVKNFKKSEHNLFPVRTAEFAGAVFGNMADAEPAPLEEQMGDLKGMIGHYPFEDMVVAHTKKYDIAANWKLLIENFLEYYHLAAVHPSLCEVSTIEHHAPRPGAGKFCAYVTAPLTNGGTPVDPNVAPAFPGIGEENKETAWHVVMYPNVFMSIYPHHMFRVVAEPVAPGRTIEHASLLVHKDLLETEEGREKAKGFFEMHNLVNTEDLEICEKMQKAMSCKQFDGGRFSFRFEEPLHRFQNMLVDSILGIHRIPDGSHGQW